MFGLLECYRLCEDVGEGYSSGPKGGEWVLSGRLWGYARIGYQRDAGIKERTPRRRMADAQSMSMRSLPPKKSCDDAGWLTGCALVADELTRLCIWISSALGRAKGRVCE